MKILIVKNGEKIKKNISYGTKRENYRACWPLTEENLLEKKKKKKKKGSSDIKVTLVLDGP